MSRSFEKPVESKNRQPYKFSGNRAYWHTFTIVPVYFFYYRKNDPVIFQRCHGFTASYPA